MVMIKGRKAFRQPARRVRHARWQATSLTKPTSLWLPVISLCLGLACFGFFSPLQAGNHFIDFFLESSGIVACSYDGNCPVGQICNTSSTTCESFLDIQRIDNNQAKQARLDQCAKTCLEELKVDEWYLYNSIPNVKASHASTRGGCVLHYKRQAAGSSEEEKVTATLEEWMQGRFRRVVRVDPSPKSSNMWMAYCHDPCHADEDCTDGFECIGRQKATLPLPKIKKSPKSCQQQSPNNNNNRQGTTQNDMYIISGADSLYFKGLKNFAASLKYWSPHRKLVVYNLGMTDKQLEKVQSWSNVHRLHWKDGIPSHYPEHVRQDLKNYAWKPLIINETVHEYKSIFWLDAGATFTGPVDPIEEILHRHGLFLVHGQDDNMKDLSHKDTYRALGYRKKSFHGGPHFAGGIQGHVYPSRYINSIVIPNAECALDESCIAPAGSSLMDHRFDQTSLSILAYSDHVRAPHYTEYLAGGMDQLNQNLSLPSSRFIMWTARGDCRHYSHLGILKH